MVVGAAAVQRVEVRMSFRVEANHLRVEDCRDLDPRRFLDNARVTARPVVAVMV